MILTVIESYRSNILNNIVPIMNEHPHSPSNESTPDLDFMAGQKNI